METAVQQLQTNTAPSFHVPYQAILPKHIMQKGTYLREPLHFKRSTLSDGQRHTASFMVVLLTTSISTYWVINTVANISSN